MSCRQEIDIRCIINCACVGAVRFERTSPDGQGVGSTPRLPDFATPPRASSQFAVAFTSSVGPLYRNFPILRRSKSFIAFRTVPTALPGRGIFRFIPSVSSTLSTCVTLTSVAPAFTSFRAARRMTSLRSWRLTVCALLATGLEVAGAGGLCIITTGCGNDSTLGEEVPDGIRSAGRCRSSQVGSAVQQGHSLCSQALRIAIGE